jgi:voltage-gated potassium channel
MTVAEDIAGDEKDLGYEIFIALVSILSVFNLGFVYVPWIDVDTRNVVEIINVFLTIIFLFDFGYRLTTAHSRSYYFLRDWGWADLLACIPVLRFLRIFRIFKAYRLVKKQGTAKIIDYLSNKRADFALYLLVFSVILILEVGSIMVLAAEAHSPQANITTAGDALWWGYVTITTVGYGDQYPVTAAGRLVGVVVMTTGVGIFATFAGFIANKLLAPKDTEETVPEQQISRFENQVLKRMDEIQSSLLIQERKTNEISARIKQLETIVAPDHMDQSSEPEKKEPPILTNCKQSPTEDQKKTSYKSAFWKNVPDKKF